MRIRRSANRMSARHKFKRVIGTTISMQINFIKSIVTKNLEAIDTEDRIFEGIATAEMIDKQDEITVRDALLKQFPIWMKRGAPIMDTHTNRHVGKGLNYSPVEVVDPKTKKKYYGIKLTAQIFKDNKNDDTIWNNIVDGTYKGLSFGGANKSEREPVKQADGSFAYKLNDLELYEMSVCREPAVPLAVITDFNKIAKATTSEELSAMKFEELEDNKIAVKCGKIKCYVVSGDPENHLKNKTLITSTDTSEVMKADDKPKEVVISEEGDDKEDDKDENDKEEKSSLEKLDKTLNKLKNKGAQDKIDKSLESLDSKVRKGEKNYIVTDSKKKLKNKGAICPVCEGEGEVVADNYGKIHVIDSYSGSGGEILECPKCHGVGELSKSSKIKNKANRTSRNCIECKGKGIMYDPRGPGDQVNYYQIPPMSDTKLNELYKKIECWDCDGTGLNPDYNKSLNKLEKKVNVNKSTRYSVVNPWSADEVDFNSYEDAKREAIRQRGEVRDNQLMTAEDFGYGENSHLNVPKRNIDSSHYLSREGNKRRFD